MRHMTSLERQKAKDHEHIRSYCRYGGDYGAFLQFKVVSTIDENVGLDEAARAAREKEKGDARWSDGSCTLKILSASLDKIVSSAPRLAREDVSGG
ncbi:hypothetical protein N7481_006756 [Penicillium waksmanii]|uniref:uncharacterized protein n=1 Tax=Penicillium waksmanii TaxID=69791 RepID=UPI002549716E|nr:uncharacterized protein N7481_006756 [Penicillium waksmanii]KAJ5984657.1 hypothetical protein N7481_006756 [Penicillium waksmanii]